MHLDASLFRWINRLADRTSWAHGLFRSNANVGIVVFAALLLIVFLIGRHNGDSPMVAGAVWSGAAPLVALVLGQVIGGAVDRARPYEAMSNVHVLVSKTTDFSFPSDHATVAGAVAVGLLFANRRWGIVASVFAVLMAFTRVYVGAHYPADVLAALVLGGAVAAAGALTLVPLLTRLVDRLATSPVRPLVTARKPTVVSVAG
jgi:membrane-associated phospholipid phosphatase